MMNLSQQPHAVQQIDADGVMIGISRQWYEEAKAELTAYEDTGLSPVQIEKLLRIAANHGIIVNRWEKDRNEAGRVHAFK